MGTAQLIEAMRLPIPCRRSRLEVTHQRPCFPPKVERPRIRNSDPRAASQPASVETVRPRSGWESCIVAAPGPSLSVEIAERAQASGLPVVAVNDAYRRLPGAAVLYACDAAWWRERAGAREFEGECWSSIGRPGRFRDNDKTREQHHYGLRLIYGQDGRGFSVDPEHIHYGSNSGFQAVNLALLMGARRIVLLGFDMQGSHFFGAHKLPLRNTHSYVNFIRAFNEAAKRLPHGVEIVNANPLSALACFPRMDYDDALAQISRCGVADRCEPVSAVAVAG